MVEIKEKIIYIIDEEEFCINDIVEVQVDSLHMFTGKLIDVNTSFIKIDCSSKYNSNIIEILPSTIYCIQLIKSREELI